MNALRVCIGSNDGVHIAPTHMGDTGEFFIYDVFAQRDAKFIDARTNVAIDMEHASGEKMKMIIGILSDVDVFIANKDSPNFRRIAANTKHEPIVVKAQTVVEALRLIQKSFREIERMVAQRQSAARSVETRELSLDA
ncbi:MAG: NifB/NifX family molybdenum-iron cluster-binding protein [Candidatus Lernaella stagnicola]|nr:NifB/NifX family molybdenum-iron cluster-binding protein [Candidatus Lernaella stagnicola]